MTSFRFTMTHNHRRPVYPDHNPKSQAFERDPHVVKFPEDPPPVYGYEPRQRGEDAEYRPPHHQVPIKRTITNDELMDHYQIGNVSYAAQPDGQYLAIDTPDPVDDHEEFTLPPPTPWLTTSRDYGPLLGVLACAASAALVISAFVWWLA